MSAGLQRNQTMTLVRDGVVDGDGLRLDVRPNTNGLGSHALSNWHNLPSRTL